MASNFKGPPSLEKNTSYDAWLKEISIWQIFRDIDIKKERPDVFLTLEGKACASVLELNVKEINCDSGVKNIVNCLKVTSATKAFFAISNPRSIIDDFFLFEEKIIFRSRDI